MRYLKIHREGRVILLTILLVLVLFNLCVFLKFSANTVFLINLIITSALLVFCLYFFRNPLRIVEIDDPNLVVAPSDGTVVVIEPTEEMEYFGDKRIQVSIFMSVFNVHANWYPVAGTVIKSVHHRGNYHAAYLPKSSTENERSTVVIETENKQQILLRQVAGAVARRIVTYAKPGDKSKINEHLGFIKFGSRVDLYFPLDTEILVKHGQKVTGNETIIARLKA